MQNLFLVKKKQKKTPQTNKLLYRTLVTSRKLKRRNIYLCQNLQSEDAFMNLKSDGFLVVLKNKKVSWSNCKTSKRVWPVQDKKYLWIHERKMYCIEKERNHSWSDTACQKTWWWKCYHISVYVFQWNQTI